MREVGFSRVKVFGLTLRWHRCRLQGAGPLNAAQAGVGVAEFVRFDPGGVEHAEPE
jgi:hypothetical protein